MRKESHGVPNKNKQWHVNNRRNNRLDAQKAHNKQYNEVFDTAKQLGVDLRNADNDWNTKIVGQEAELLSPGIFNSDVQINRLMSLKKQIPAILVRGTLVSTAEKGMALTGFVEEDIWDLRANNISISDIEQMEYPLTKDDIKEVTKMFGSGKFRKNKKQNFMIETLGVFAAKNKLDGDGSRVPSQLKPLYNRITNFFDFYTNSILDRSLNGDDRAFFSYWYGLGTPFLDQALRSYIPASLGISPSSTMKLYSLHGKEGGLLLDKTWSFYIGKAEKEISHSFRKGAIPENLEKYLQYSPVQDERAKGFIEGYYRRSTEEERVQAYKSVAELTPKTRAYFRKIAGRLRAEPEKPLSFEMPSNKSVQEVLLTAQDKRTLIFIVKFGEGDTHLTLEMTEKGQLFGFPPDLLINNEDLAISFAKDMLTDYLHMVREMHPGVNEEETARQFILRENVKVNVDYDDEEEVVFEKKKGFGKVFSSIPFVGKGEGEKPLPRASMGQNREFVVVSSRSYIELLMGSGIDPKVVDKITSGIKDFEDGRITPESEDDRSVLNIDGWKIDVSNTGGKYFYIEAITPRQ